jgi:hypothetical protein
MKRPQSLRTVRTDAATCRLPRDNWSYGDYWILGDNHEVTIAHQRTGEPSRAMFSIPRGTFNRLIDFYQADQRPATKRRAKGAKR